MMSEYNAAYRSIRTRIFMLAGLLLFCSAITPAQTEKPRDIVGVWFAEDQTLKLDMFQAGQEYNARLLWGDRIMEKDGVTYKPDSKNPDPSLRSRSTKGIVFIKGLTWNSCSYTNGTLYDASSGRTYRCKAEVKDGKLLLRGYAGMSLLGKTITFYRSN